MDKHQSIKRLGYGFSALVMALSTVAFVPGFSNAANAAEASCVTATEADALQAALAAGLSTCLGGDIAFDSESAQYAITVDATLDLGGHTITSTKKGSIFSVSSGVTLTIKNGAIVQNGEAAIFGGGGTVKIASGSYSSALQIFGSAVKAEISGGNFTGKLGGSAKVTGGTFSYEVTPEAGLAAYKQTDGTYWVANKQNLTATAGTLPVNTEGKIGSYTVAKYENGNLIPVDVKVVDEKNNEALDKVTVNTVAWDGESATANINVVATEAGAYTITLTGEDKSTATIALTAFEIVEESKEGTSLIGATYELTDDSDRKELVDDYQTAVGKDVTISNIIISGEVADRPVTAARGNDTKSPLMTGVKAGFADVTLELNTLALEKQTITFGVNVYNTQTVKTAAKAGADATELAYSGQWGGVEYTTGSKDIVEVSLAADEKTGKVAVSYKPVSAGLATVKLTSAYGNKTKTLDFAVYNVAESATMKTTDAPVSAASLIDLPEGYTATAAITTDGGAISLTDGWITAKTDGAGKKSTVTFTITAPTDGIAIDTQTVDVYVYDTEAVATKAIADQYVSMSGTKTLDAGALYTTMTNGVVEVTTDDDTTKIANNVATFTTTGEKTLTYTEKVGTETVNTITSKVYVTGVALEDADIWTATDEEKPYSAVVYSIDPEGTLKSVKGSDGLTVEQDETDATAYTVSAAKKGAYTLTVVVNEKVSDNGVTQVFEDKTYNYTITAYEEVDVEAKDDSYEIDLADDKSSVTLTVTGDGVITVEKSKDAEDALVLTDNGDGTYTVTAAKDAEAGNYAIVALQTIAGTELKAGVNVEINVVDSTEPEIHYEEVKADAQYVTAGTAFTVEVAEGSRITGTEGFVIDEGVIVAAMNDGSHLVVRVGDEAKAGKYTVLTDTEANASGAVTRTYVTFYVIDVEAFGADNSEVAAFVLDTLQNGTDAYWDVEGTYPIKVIDKGFIFVDDDAMDVLANGTTIKGFLSYNSSVEYGEDDDLSELIAKFPSLIDAETEQLIAASDITYDLYANGEWMGSIYELDKKADVAMMIPEDYLTAEAGYTRNFFVIRAHNGGYTRIEGDDLTIEDGAVMFKNDKFSTFYLGYYDTLNASVDTGAFTGEAASASSASVALTAASAVVAALLAAGAIKFAKRK